MGNQGSSKSSFEQNNWRKIEQRGFRSILYNDITMKSVEKHEAVVDFDEGEVTLLCQWRAKLPPQSCVVDLYEFGIRQVGLCNSQAELYVITERVHLLQNIGSISKAEAFLILRDVAQALRILFKKFGFFTPQPNLIGINSEGRAKVWINENFAKLECEKEEIPVEKSELGVVNNLISLISDKVYPNDNFPIDYPRNLDFKAVYMYITNVFENLQGFKVDRVYLDRGEFAKKYHEHRELEERELRSRMVASEADRRLQEINQLHENLRLHQEQLAQKQRQIQRQIQYQMEKQRQVEHQSQMLNAMQMQALRPMPSYYIMDGYNDFSRNSRDKMLLGTASTNKSSNPPFYKVASTPKLLQPQRQSLPPQIFNPRLPPVPRQQNIQPIYQQQQKPQSKPQSKIEHKENVPLSSHQQSLKKSIQMVDSMILMGNEESMNGPTEQIESRIVRYKF